MAASRVASLYPQASRALGLVGFAMLAAAAMLFFVIIAWWVVPSYRLKRRHMDPSKRANRRGATGSRRRDDVA